MGIRNLKGVCRSPECRFGDHFKGFEFIVQMAGADIHMIKLLILEGNWLLTEERPQQEPRRELIEAWAGKAMTT